MTRCAWWAAVLYAEEILLVVILNDYNKISNVESSFFYQEDAGILTFSFMTYALVKLSIYNPITVTFFYSVQ